MAKGALARGGAAEAWQVGPQSQIPGAAGKMRPIDDYSISRINAALGAIETIDPSDVDHIAANCRAHADALVADPAYRSSSSSFAGLQRHADLKGATLVAKNVDIASAYRNLARRPSQAELAVIAVWNPRRHIVEFFAQVSMPFGASSAVLSFNWTAVGLCRILNVLFKIGCTNFYDDFTVVEASTLAASAETTVEEVFRMLGWQLKPLPGFSARPTPLGAVIGLERAEFGEVTIANRPVRTQELAGDLRTIGAAAELPLQPMLKLRGRLLFARSLCFGRFATRALRAVNHFCAVTEGVHGKPAPQQAVDDVRGALQLLASVVTTAPPPRRLCTAYPSPVMLFTDAAFEPAATHGRLSLGGVVLDVDTGLYEFFALLVDEGITTALLRVTENPIAEGEALAVAVALVCWKRCLAGRPVLGFIDNEAARHAIVKGGASTDRLADVVASVNGLEIGHAVAAYWERVPSHSNIADLPSRGLLPPALDFLEPPVCIQAAVHVRHFPVALPDHNLWEGRDLKCELPPRHKKQQQVALARGPRHYVHYRPWVGRK